MINLEWNKIETQIQKPNQKKIAWNWVARVKLLKKTIFLSAIWDKLSFKKMLVEK